MKNVRGKRIALLLASAACAWPSVAYSQLAPAPVRETIDGNGVDLFRGKLVAKETLLSLGGEGNEALTYARITRGPVTTTTLDNFLSKLGTTTYVQVAGYTDRFTESGSTYTNTEGNGATLTFDTNTYTYTARDGTVVTFSKYQINESDLSKLAGGNEAYATEIIEPNGARLTLSYDAQLYCETYDYYYNNGEPYYLCSSFKWIRRLATAKNASGYVLSAYYENASDPDAGAAAELWVSRMGVKAINRAVESCDASNCSTTTAWPSVGTVYGNTTSVPSKTYTTSSDGIMAITHPGDSNPSTSISYSGGKVYQVVNANGTTTYGYSDSGSARTVTATNGLSQTASYVFDIASERLTSVTDALSRTVSYQYDGSGRVTRITQPEGNYTQISYDTRGNATETRRVAKSGSGLSDIVTSASYPSSCSDPATCNQPTSTTDGRGNVTSYTYDSSHGGVLSVTRPAPTSGAPAPQQRFSYDSFEAQVYTTGGLVGTGIGVTLPTAVSQCRTSSSCTGAADELVQTISYPGAGTPNNLQPASVTQAAGDASISLTTSFGYDRIGNRITIDGPASGTGDTTRIRYNDRRQMVGMVSLDPDGSGGNPPLAVKNTFDAAGRLVRTETGTVADQSDTAWAGFGTTQGYEYAHDAYDRIVRRAAIGGGLRPRGERS